MTKKYWIGTGWKMNHLLPEAKDYAKKLEAFIKDESPKSNLFICPPFTAISNVSEILKEVDIHVAAQNMHWQEKGAVTGEISPLMIKDAGGNMVELGHSERRANFGESDHTVNLKVKAALQQDLLPLVCIGDSAEEKKKGISSDILTKQVIFALDGIQLRDKQQLILAYEPVWAIGEHGTPASPEFANEMQGFIKETITQEMGEDLAHNIPVLYGGSVNQNNALELIKQPNIDGLFIGRAAWKVEGFIAIIKLVERYFASCN